MLVALAVLELAILLAVTYGVLITIRNGVVWKHLSRYLALEVILTIVTIWVVLAPYLDAVGWD